MAAMVHETRGEPNVVSLIVPTYREAENLALLVPRVAEALRGSPFRYELIIVDDNSNDGTDEACARLAADGHPIRLVVRTGERGLSSAVIRGFREAMGDILVCMDADLSHPPEAIPEMVAQSGKTSADIVIGSRYCKGGSTEEDWGLFRWLNSRVATLLAKPLTKAKDPMAGFFAISREAFERARDLNPIGYKIGLELIVKCNCTSITEVPIRFADRKFGQSKLIFREQLNYLKHLKRLYDFRFGNASLFLQFCVVGATGVVIDLSAYALLLHLGLAIALGRALAIWIAMTWNFALNRRLTFTYSRKASILPQYFRYVASCGLGALVSWSTSMGLVQTVGWFEKHIFLAATIGILLGTVVNFVLSRTWVFRKVAAGGR